jgi:HK97 gp10 family phage protein
MSATVQIRGFADLERALDRIGDAAGKALADAAMAGAIPVTSMVAMRAPVLTGNLRRSYHGESGESGANIGPGGARVLKAGPREAVVVIGTDVEYAPYVEFGTSRMAARAHFRPGLEAGKRVFASEAARVLGDILARAAR